MKQRKEKTHKRKYKWIYLVDILFVILGTLFMLYALSLLTGIENKIRLLFSIDLVLIVGFFFYLLKINLKKARFKKIFAGFWIIYSIILSIVGFYIYTAYHSIDKLSSTSTTYYSSLITLATSEVESISDITSGKIGYLSDETSIDGNMMPLEIIETEQLSNEVVLYDSYEELIDALYQEEVEYIFLPGNYFVMFSSEYEDIEDKTKVLYTKDKDLENELASSGSSLSEPFTVLIMGVDSENENIQGSSFNGDALMLLTFNPTTLNATILSIPRDSYVPIACFTGKAKNKITHAAWYGADCMMNTIEDFLDIDIDYYVKINFKGVVKLIDTLGGVDVDVPYSFCEQDSNRHFGTSTIYVKEGLQTLNGEQALALSRNRKSNSSKCSSEWTSGVRNDFVRGQNQQLVLRAILNKLKTVSSLDTVTKLLSTISNNMETNMTTSEILSLYNIGKDILKKSNGDDMDELLGFTRLYLNGEDAYIYDTRSGLNLYNYVLYDNSVNAVSNAMKINLGLVEPVMEKNFSFDMNEEYEEEIIGKYETGKSSVVKLPSFIGMSEQTATSKAKSLGLSVTFRYVTSGSGTNLTVIKQSVTSGTDVSTISSLILTVLKEETKTEDASVESNEVVDNSTLEEQDEKDEEVEENTSQIS